MGSGTLTKAILSLQKVVKGFGAQPVLRDVSLTVHAADRIGLIGANGSGKSTLLKIMAGEETADEGLVTRSQGLRVGLLAQTCGLALDQTVGEALESACAEVRALQVEYEGLLADLSGREGRGPQRARHETRLEHLEHELELTEAWELGQAAKRVSVALDLPDAGRSLATLSGGELRRVDLAGTLIRRPDLLLLDEPTNQIDTRSVEWIEGFLASYRGSCILVTHDRYFLDRVVTRIVEVTGTRLFCYGGKYAEFLAHKARVLDTERRAELNRQALLKRELAWLRQGAKARTTKQKARIQRIDQLEGVESAAPEREFRFAIPDPRPLGKIVLEATGLARRYGERWLFQDLDLLMQRGMRVGVVGPNGCGKTTLLRTLMGLEEPEAGQVRVGEATQFLFVDQMRGEVDPEQSILEFVSNGLWYWYVGEQRLYVPTYLEGFLFDRDSVHMPMRNLSGGECNRVRLARQLLRGGNFLVFDEPTNDLDLATLRVLEEAVIAHRGCALLVSHDRYFLNRVCTHLLVFEDDGRVVQITGDYDDYLLYRQRKDAARPKAPREARADKPSGRRREGPRGLTWTEKRELEGIEEAISAAEAEAARLEAAINAPGFYEQPYDVVAETLRGREEAVEATEALYARWTHLDEIQSAYRNH